MNAPPSPDSVREVPVAPAIPHRVFYAVVTVTLASLPQYAGLLGVFRDHLQRYLDLNLAQYGVLLSAGYLPGAVGALIAGLWLQRERPRVVVGFAMAGAGLGFGLAAAAGRSYPLLIAGLGLVYFANNALWIALQSYLVRLFPDARRRMVTFGMMMTAALGIFISLLMEYLLRLSRPGGLSFGWVLHAPFAVLGLMMLAGALLYRRPLGTVAVTEDHVGAGLPPRWSDPRPWLLVAMLTVHGASDMAAWLWVPRVLASASYATAPIAPGVVLAAFNLAYVVARVLLMTLPERAGRSLLLILPGLCGGGLFVAGVLSRNYPLTVAGYLAGAFCWSSEAPAITSELAHVAGRRFGTLLSFTAVGSAAGTFVFGAMMGWWGNQLPETQLWRVLFVPALGFVTVGTLGMVWWLCGRQAPRQDAAADPILS